MFCSCRRSLSHADASPVAEPKAAAAAPVSADTVWAELAGPIPVVELLEQEMAETPIVFRYTTAHLADLPSVAPPTVEKLSRKIAKSKVIQSLPHEHLVSGCEARSFSVVNALRYPAFQLWVKDIENSNRSEHLLEPRGHGRFRGFDGWPAHVAPLFPVVLDEAGTLGLRVVDLSFDAEPLPVRDWLDEVSGSGKPSGYSFRIVSRHQTYFEEHRSGTPEPTRAERARVQECLDEQHSKLRFLRQQEDARRKYRGGRRRR